MEIKGQRNIKNNFSNVGIFSDEQIALFATINAAYEGDGDSFKNLIDHYCKRYNLSGLQSELFISSKDCLGSYIQITNKDSNLFTNIVPKIKIYHDTGLKIGISSMKNDDGKITIFIGISGYQANSNDAKAVLIRECKGVMQGQVIQAVSIINQFNKQINKNIRDNKIEYVFGGHSLGGNIIQSVAAILSLSENEFSNKYSLIKSKEFKNRTVIVAKQIYTFNTLQPKIFLDSEFNFLKDKTINFVIDNDWLLRVLRSTNGSYIGEIKLYEKRENEQQDYYFEKMNAIGDIPVNIKERVISDNNVRDIYFKDIIKSPSIKLIKNYVVEKCRSPIIAIKCFIYVSGILSYKNINSLHEHGALNFIDKNPNEKKIEN